MFGFGFNKEKSRAKAEGYLQQNKLPNAIAEYEKILAVEPRDLAILNTVGDIYSRLGQSEKAVERFRVVGESYVADGFTLKAIAMYKKITKLDTSGLAAMEKLAELYRKQGLVSDARSMLLQTAEAYSRKGQSKETLRLLKQLVLFDPENVQVITRTADLMIQGGQKQEAKEMLSQTAATLVERHSLEPAQKILDRLIALDRSNLRAQELRAQVTLDLGDAEKAAELYEAIPDLDSRADGLRNLLAAYLKLGKLEDAIPTSRKLVSVHHDVDGVAQVAARFYKENETQKALDLYREFAAELLAQDKEDMLAHLHGAVARLRNNADALQTLYNLFQRAGDSSSIAEVLELLAHASVQANQLERARDAYKELIELEPENGAHIQGYRQVCARLSPEPPTSANAEAATADTPRTLEDFLAINDPDLPSQNYPPPVEECISTALSEADLCESFSSKTRGISALESALQSAPEDLRLNRALAQLYRQSGEASKAACCYSTMQRVLESMGQSEAADFYASRAGSNQTTTWEAKGSEFAARDFEMSASTGEAAGNAEEIDLSNEWESVWQDADAAQTTPAQTPIASQPPTPPASAAVENVSELLDEVRFCVAQQIWDEAETAVARLAKVRPNHPELAMLCAEIRKNRPKSGAGDLNILPSHYAPVEVIEVAEHSSPSATLPRTAPTAPPSFPLAAPATAPSLSSLAAELDAELGDSFVPVPQPRREAPTPARAAQPPVSRPVAQPVAPYLPAAAPAYAAHTASQSQPSPPPYIAPPIAAEPEAVFSPSVFGNLLQNFEQELTTPQEDNDDPETHFNLGIAFHDMGLLDEAIGELQKVCRLGGNGLSADRTQQAYIWLATCFVEKSVPEASLNWFERALEAAPDADSRTAVNYELASAYEAAGRKREALDHFLEVYGTNIDYRDVASRIRELRSSV
jgi:tetratricopeptide (TPR) repeat protein